MSDLEQIPHARYDGRWTVERWIIRIERWGSIAFLLVIVGLVVLQVVTRYLLAHPPLWSEEMARYALVWLTFIGAAWLGSINDHLTVHGLDVLLSLRGKVVLDAIVQLAVGVTAVVVLVNSSAFLRSVANQHSAAGGISMLWVYGCVALGLALIALHAALIFAKDVLYLVGRGDLAHLAAQDIAEEGMK